MEKTNFEQMKIEALKKHNDGTINGFADFVRNNAHNMKKDELVELIQELDYVLYDNTTKTEYAEIINKTVKSIKAENEDYWEQ